MKLPRNVSGDDLVKGLRRVGYETRRQVGDHVRMTTQENGEHHVSVPLHNPLKVGTLSAILMSVASHLRLSREQLLHLMKV
jgi:predicted RNA binding protein YcfA (HicA-like mRNA interferase family)